MGFLTLQTTSGVERPSAQSPATYGLSDAQASPLYSLLKRLLDITLSLVALVVLSPMMAAIAILVKLDSPGPALFSQTRIGKRARPFQILKFRTMHQDLDDSCHQAFMRAFVRGEINADNPTPANVASIDDSCLMRRIQDQSDPERGEADFKPFENSQVTRVGRILRKTSLDELPQLVNVIRGDMSLVGPRPNVPWEVEEYLDWQRERLAVLPGITGLAQINGRSAIDFDQIVSYDIEYIRTRTIWLDLRILFQTFVSVVEGRGAH
jgi:lipopolysaccharide/colanic/teichoic acid biosynthesis glycosyltransferase